MGPARHDEEARRHRRVEAGLENAVASGFRQEEIAALLGISDRTLRTRYRQQLDKGAVKVHAKVTAWLLDLALQDDDSASACRPQAYGCERVSAGAKPTRRRQAAAKLEVHHRPVLTVPGMMDPQEWNRLAEEHGQQIVRITSAGQRPQLSVVDRSGPEERLAAAEQLFRECVEQSSEPEWKRRRKLRRQEQAAEALKSGSLDG